MWGSDLKGMARKGLHPNSSGTKGTIFGFTDNSDLDISFFFSTRKMLRRLCCQELQKRLDSNEGLLGWDDGEALLVKWANWWLAPCVRRRKTVGLWAAYLPPARHLVMELTEYHVNQEEGWRDETRERGLMGEHSSFYVEGSEVLTYFQDIPHCLSFP